MNITVTIPNQIYDSSKYERCGDDEEPCYLKEALIKEGYTNVNVSGFGSTCINGKYYRPQESFNAHVVQSKFSQGKDVEVILVPSNLNHHSFFK